MALKLTWIVLFPLLGFIINGLIGQKLRKPAAGYIATLAVLLAFIVAVVQVATLANLPAPAPQSEQAEAAAAQPETAPNAAPAGEAAGPRQITETAYTWMSVHDYSQERENFKGRGAAPPPAPDPNSENVGGFHVQVSFLLDPLSAVMILIITGIGFLIHLYSVGYMQHDHNDPDGSLYARYFAFFNLFIAFMSVLVLADNYLLMFVGWEGVGLCSYFLIGYWFQREDAAEASKKAFIMNRIGDFGFLLGMMLIFLTVGSLNYHEVFSAVRANPNLFSEAAIAGSVGGLTTVTLLLFLGATGKSAQIPLFTWLPDAMAGPTPVSALIHAATMVTAGVYMTARSSVLFEAAPQTKIIVCVVGAATALVAGLTALAHSDIKKVLAYSTVSQLGFMFMGVGAGAYIAAIFHVFTHAFFKACLFLGSGSVIHALHGEQDMRKMGGLANKMKATHITFMLSGLALAGAVPFAGFFSKDEIIGAVYAAGSRNPVYILCAIVALVTALITALYTGRQYAQVFLGQPRDEHLYEHAHESPAVMTAPLWILAVGSVVAGLVGIPGAPTSTHLFANWLEPAFPPHAGEAVNFGLLVIGAVIGWAGWAWGRSLGLNANRNALPATAESWSLDELYNQVVVKTGFALAAVLDWFDRNVVDGIVNTVGFVVQQSAQALRLTQTSFVRSYALAMALGAVVVVGYFLVAMTH